MKTVKAWAVVDRISGAIFMDSIDAGMTWQPYIRMGTKARVQAGLMDDYDVVRCEIRLTAKCKANGCKGVLESK